jgi:Raf kinase inhibitor-like YbhB/YbcL family protein
MKLKCPAFSHGDEIPRRFTLDGPNLSPPLSWTEPPTDTLSFALLMKDEGSWSYWVLFDLPSGTRELPEGMPREGELSSGGRQGVNSWHKLGYAGPARPGVRPIHPYVIKIFIRLYALDAPTNLDAGANYAAVERAIEGHVLAQAELMCTIRIS